MPAALRYSRADLSKRLAWEDLDTDYLRQIIGLAKIEDLAGAGLANKPERLGDITSALLPDDKEGRCQLVAREPMVVCGLPLVPLILETYKKNHRFTPHAADGDFLPRGTVLGDLEGTAPELLQAERIILNFLQHLSGIASETRRYADELSGSPTILLDTRKTLPGHRVLQKYAFARGGGYNHRIGLFDRIMLKDNHLAVAGAPDGNRLTETIDLARRACEDLPIQVEIDRLEQIRPVLDAGADIILLDNFTTAQLQEAVEQIEGRALTEASGGIQLENLAETGAIGLDFISTGAPVHQSRWKDIGLDWA